MSCAAFLGGSSSGGSSSSSGGSATSTGACIPASGITVIEVATQEPGTAFQRVTYRPAGPEVVYAFRIDVPNTSALIWKTASATKTPQTIGGKLVVVSTCKGDVSTVGKPDFCQKIGTENTAMGMTINQSPYGTCVLTPGTTYWVHVVAVPAIGDDGGAVPCDGPTTCAFDFEIT